ncbi:lipopolysaccharide biosynthesis protein [Longispora albida]|uniref:lipopolysaccharide biosynthesis protein n=1 Tax=Longispora albida TaxID=203523 RepID=UPI00037F0E94|nr:lipopolysaccharide biosynthesis protein [Longispora albida]
MKKAVGWSYILTGGRLVVTMVVMLLLARLLGPAAFGVLALALVLVNLVQAVLQQGLMAAIIQRSDLRPEHLNAAFWLLLGLSVVLAGVLAALTPLYASVTGSASLTGVCLALTPLLPMLALSLIPEALLRRELKFKTLTVRSLSSVLAGGVAGLGLALAGYGVWALAAQQLVMAGVGVAVLWFTTDWRPGRPAWKPAKELWAFSSRSALASVGLLVGTRGYLLVTGAFFGTTAVGLLRLASRLSETLVDVAARSLQQVSLPALSRLQDDKQAFAAQLGKFQHMGALLGLPTLGVLAGIAHPFMVLLGADWAPAADALQLLCLVGAVNVYGVLLGPALQAAGRPGALSVVLWGQAVLSVGGYAAVGLLTSGSSVAAQVTGIALTTLVSEFVAVSGALWYTMRRVLGVPLWPALAPTVPAALAGVVGFLTVALGDRMSRSLDPLLAVILEGAAGVLVVGALVLGFDTRARDLAGRLARRLTPARA